MREGLVTPLPLLPVADSTREKAIERQVKSCHWQLDICKYWLVVHNRQIGLPYCLGLTLVKEFFMHKHWDIIQKHTDTELTGPHSLVGTGTLAL